MIDTIVMNYIHLNIVIPPFPPQKRAVLAAIVDDSFVQPIIHDMLLRNIVVRLPEVGLQLVPKQQVRLLRHHQQQQQEQLIN